MSRHTAAELTLSRPCSKYGADIAKENNYKMTPLRFAVQYGHLDVMNVLLNGSRASLGTIDLLHLSSAEHHNNCTNDLLNHLKCLVTIYPEDAFLQRGLANEYFRAKMYFEAKESYEIYVRVAMENAGITQVDKLQHFGYNCDGCTGDLYGAMYKCIECDWCYDACEACFKVHLHANENAMTIAADNYASAHVARHFLNLLAKFQQSFIQDVIDTTSSLAKPFQNYEIGTNLIRHVEMHERDHDQFEPTSSTRSFEQASRVAGHELRWFEIELSSVQSIEDPNSIRDALCITLETTSKARRVSADRIGQYVMESWGQLGVSLLDWFLSALETVRRDGSAVQDVNFGPSAFQIVASPEYLVMAGRGSGAEWTTIIECFIWLLQVIGSPKEGVVYRPWEAEMAKTPSLISDSSETKRLFSPQSRVWETANMGRTCGFTIRFKPGIFINRPDVPNYLQIPPFHRCWLNLVESTYIGQRRVQTIVHDDYGIRIPFQIMIELAAVEHMTSCMDGVVMTGYDTVLIPVRRIEDIDGPSIVWHVLRDERLLEDGIFVNIETVLKSKDIVPISIESWPLPEAIGYLGWSEEVKVTLGSQKPNRRPERSQLGTGNTLMRRIVGKVRIYPGLSIGPFGYVTLTGAGTQPFPETGTRPKSSHKINYHRRVEMMINETVVIYCTFKSRAWLVPKINVILYMIRIHVMGFGGTAVLPEMKYPPKPSFEEAFTEMKRLETKVIIQKDSPEESETLFRDLFTLYFEELQFALQQMKTRSNDSSICGVELCGHYRWN